MAGKRVLRFPEDFLWGTANAAYQCEGGNTNNQWYRWEQQGHILSGDSCGDAADWWQRAEADFERAEQMENNALRLSLEWSRIEPEEGRLDSSAIDRYRAMLSDLRQRHILPMVTLHHFTEPLWFADRGGFTDPANIRYFLRYVKYVVSHLQDLCDFWITFNEPNVYAAMGYLIGTFPPGEHDLKRTLLVIHNLLQAHVAAFYAISELQPESRIGYCLHYRLFDPANPFWLPDVVTASLQEESFNWALLKAAETGHFSFPLNFAMKPLARARGTRDYHGVNYYTREMVHFDPTKANELFARRFNRPGAVMNDPGAQGSFGEIYPEGLYRVLKSVYRLTRGNKPLYITENGFCDARDDRRPRAILEHLAMVHRAIQEGIPVRGYLHWTLVDNFEWAEGWSARFGLIELNQHTQERVPRISASLYGEICRANAITEDMVERYAPEAIDTIFGLNEKAGSTTRIFHSK
ncbi:MAG TPA: glycoside hydrolase family 1 protein [Ktedonobacteraceae bacterium]|nr:glycoside hydrolase family 1 protein [Ktedonobacteraceae bacterium]